jgi:hypothetical protein
LKEKALVDQRTASFRAQSLAIARDRASYADPKNKIMLVETTDEHGNPVKLALTGREMLQWGGNGFAVKPTTLTKSRMEAAVISSRAAEDVIKYAREHPNILSVQGGVQHLMDAAIPPGSSPEYVRLHNMIGAWVQSLPAVHGMRARGIAEDLQKGIKMSYSPETFEQAVLGIDSFSERLAQDNIFNSLRQTGTHVVNGRLVKGGGTPSAPSWNIPKPPTSLGGGTRIVRDKVTGKIYRIPAAGKYDKKRFDDLGAR